MIFNKRSSYRHLNQEDGENLTEKRSSPSRPLTWHSIWALICTFTAIAGFFVGQTSRDHSFDRDSSGELQLETVVHAFRYGHNFSYPPSERTNRAWRSMFPEKGGFFTHPTIAPEWSTFSVFHQLHCLNGLRGGYFANAHAAQAGQKLLDEDLPGDMQMAHMRHCIDLIRQSLMCQPDLTIEVVDATLAEPGVHAFGTPHRCKDWNQLKDWTSEQQKTRPVTQLAVD